MHTNTSRWRAIAPRGLAALAVLALGVLAWKLAFAPIHGVHDQAGCVRAYANARTHQDSVAVDFLSYPDRSGRGIDQRCGYTSRTTTVVTLP